METSGLRLVLVLVAICIQNSAQSTEPIPTPDQIHEMELSTFYADCSVFEDPLLFGGPVCGSDQVTYPNCVHHSCVNHWRPDNQKTKIISKGECPQTYVPEFAWSPIYAPVCGVDDHTYANVEALILNNQNTGVEVLVQYEGECIPPYSSCLNVDPEYWKNAVCASNGRTYPSVQAIADLRKFGQCVDVLHDGGCTVEEVKDRIKSRTEMCDLARSFYEYNPVCGKDGVTYPNPYILLCFRPTVESEYVGECDNQMFKACTRAIDIDLGKVQSKGQVCGSDGLTYTSRAHLVCATSQDKHLFWLHDGACTAADNPCNRMSPLIAQGEPVCASDGVTYINPTALWCVQRKEDPMLMFFHDGPCFRRCVECMCSLGCNSSSHCPAPTPTQPSCPARPSNLYTSTGAKCK